MKIIETNSYKRSKRIKRAIDENLGYYPPPAKHTEQHKSIEFNSKELIMKTFSQYIEQEVDMDSIIRGFIKDVSSLPDTDDSSDLFGEKNNRRWMLSFFKDVLNGIIHPEIEELVSATNPQSMSAEEAFKLWNGAGHPVRDGLILLGINK